jgi:hypothetical protein
MRTYIDKATGKYKSGANSSALYDTKEQCHRAFIDSLTDKLAAVRKKIEQGCLNYGK